VASRPTCSGVANRISGERSIPGPLEGAWILGDVVGLARQNRNILA
jgi:hypothetical protein